MGEEKEKFLKFMVQDRELKLEHLRAEHKKDIAVFKAKEELLMKDRDLFTKELNRK